MLDTYATGIFDLEFPHGRHARALKLSTQQTSKEALEVMQLTTPQPTLVIIGGASLMTEEQLERLQAIFNQVLAPMAEAMNLTVLDGGTDAGVIHMMGQSRQSVGGQFRLIGVVPQGKVKLPNDETTDDSRHPLEPNHTDFFLIPGETWGSESKWLAEFASLISTQQPSVTVLINGGKVAFTDLEANLRTERPAVVLSGSGRLADTIAQAMQGHKGADPHVTDLIHTYQPSKQLKALDVSLPIEQLRESLQQYFV